MKGKIYKDDKDRKTFLEILTESAKIYSIKIYCYVLMSNHLHLLVETPLGNLSEFMRHFNIRYTSHYNIRHKRSGHLYQGRYKGILVDKDTYLAMLSRYIHLNPVRVKGIKGKPGTEKGRYLQKYKWSSLPGYINSRKKQDFTDYDLVLEEYGGDNKKGRQAYRNIISIEISVKMEIKEKIIRQSIIGKEEFIEWVTDKYLKTETDKRERPALREIQSRVKEGKIIRAIEKETGRNFDEIKRERGYNRYLVMELLYRVGGKKGVDIGKIMDLDYSTVSQGRRRLREKLLKDKKLRQLMGRIEHTLSRLKI